ncbi:MAG: hypothetical protein L0Z62_08320 [Gemmataceae bacterium]|nr:hypothetical protein [Gemmataceae bacterium]
MKPAEAEEKPIFKWETLKEIRRQEFRWEERAVPGTVLAVELTSGVKVEVWRADNGQDYFCHGLTFGGKAAPEGVVSPLGDHIPAILQGHYELVLPEGQARAGDILVWRGLSAKDVVHSAILTDPGKEAGKNYLDYSARLQTKNGITPETTMTLRTLVETHYGESYNVYRRKAT